MFYVSTDPLSNEVCYILIDGNKTIYFREGSTEYQKYLEWLEEGNTPEPWPDPTE